MNKATNRYFNFPIALAEGVLTGKKKKDRFLTEVLYYHLYLHYLKLAKINADDDFLELHEETELERFKRCAKYWDVNLGNAELALNEAEFIYEQNHQEKPFTGLFLSVFWDYYKNEKTDFEWDVLMAFLSLKTIVGKKKFTKSDNEMLFARMFGFRTKKEYQKTKGVQFTRYYRDKIIKELENKWNLIYYSHYTKGFYFGFAGDITLNELVFEVEKVRKSFIEFQKETAKKDAIKQALIKLKSSAP